MKAIETRYKGHRFRSRLEARWAVFFDAIGIRWEYEPEGFELEDGTRWLPDFYLPHFEGGCWVEVKPDRGRYTSDMREAYEKVDRFAFKRQMTVWLAYGSPGDRMYELWKDGMILGGCVPLASEARGEERMYWHAHHETGHYRHTHGGDEYEAWLALNGGQVRGARAKARSARFEFGEAGAG